jgi:hypothetical protein
LKGYDIESSNKEETRFIEVKGGTSIPERKRRVLIDKFYGVLRKVADKQLHIIEKFRKSKDQPKAERHLYLLEITKSFWKDGDFALALGKGKYALYATYPARTMMEKVLKVLWFSKQKMGDQDLITKKELLKQCLDYYRIEGRPDNKNRFAKTYKEINDVGLPNIDNVKRGELEAFPGYEELCQKSGLPDASTLYRAYRHLSGLPHGDLLTTFRTKGDEEIKEYRRVMTEAVRFSMEMIKVTDFQIGFATKSEVLAVTKAIDKMRIGK